VQSKGVYLAKLKDEIWPKFGMSTFLDRRMKVLKKEMSLENGVKLMGLKKIYELMGDAIEELAALTLCGNIWHKDHRQVDKDRIAMQLAEAIFACLYNTCAKTVLEQVVCASSERVVKTMRRHKFPAEVVETFKNIGNALVVAN